MGIYQFSDSNLKYLDEHFKLRFEGPYAEKGVLLFLSHVESWESNSFTIRRLMDGLGQQQQQWCGCQTNLRKWSHQSMFWLWPIRPLALGHKIIVGNTSIALLFIGLLVFSQWLGENFGLVRRCIQRNELRWFHYLVLMPLVWWCAMYEEAFLWRFCHVRPINKSNYVILHISETGNATQSAAYNKAGIKYRDQN